MSTRSLVTLLAILAFGLLTFAKDKNKKVLPAYVLRAHTVFVTIEPDAGAPVTDPAANKKALDDVEKAIAKWGFLEPVMDAQTADLIITVRKGHGKIVQPTIGGGGVNDRPVIVQSTDDSVRIGAQRGRQVGSSSGPQSGGPQSRGPQDTVHPQTEVGPAEDSFTVYQGQVEQPLERSPIWRYMAKDALRSPNVPAVTEFRKAIEETQKQQKNP